MRTEGTNETQAEMACHGQCMAPPARSDPGSHPGDGEDGHGLNCAVDSDIGGHDCTGQSVVRCLTAFVSGDPRRRSDCLADPQRRLRPRRSMVRLRADQRGARPVSKSATGHDLLFGLLALQNGLIEQDQLMNAFRAWTLDRSRNLALMRFDTDLDALRPRPEFQALLMDLAFPDRPFAP